MMLSEINNEAVFICRKCRHHLFIGCDEILLILGNLDKYNCPRCGEEGFENWVFSHLGNSDNEKENYNWK